MPDEMKNTPTPWVADTLPGYVAWDGVPVPIIKELGAADDSWIVEIAGDDAESKANAALIVRAVNAHAPLLAAAKQMLALLESEYGNGCRNGYFPGVRPVLEAGRAAIAKAEGGA